MKCTRISSENLRIFVRRLVQIVGSHFFFYPRPSVQFAHYPIGYSLVLLIQEFLLLFFGVNFLAKLNLLIIHRFPECTRKRVSLNDACLSLWPKLVPFCSPVPIFRSLRPMPRRRGSRTKIDRPSISSFDDIAPSLMEKVAWCRCIQFKT